MIAAVLFDLYETLVTERGTTPVRASSLGPLLGLDEPAFRSVWKAQRPRIIRGAISFADSLVAIAAMLGREIDPAVAQAIAERRALEKAALFERFDAEAIAVLRELRQHGLKLGVVSNAFPEDVEAWPRCAAARWFDASTFSFAVGAAKPEPRIYLEAMGRLGVEGGQALFVGDGGDDELLGAERMGLFAAQATWFGGGIAGLPAHIPRLASWRDVLDFATGG